MKEYKIGNKYIIIANEEEWKPKTANRIENLNQKIEEIIKSKSYFTEYFFHIPKSS